MPQHPSDWIDHSGIVSAAYNSKLICPRNRHGIALFYYGIFAEAEERFAAGKVKLHHIATWRDVLAVAKAQKLFDERTLSEVEAFLNAPLAWSAKNGGVAELLTT